MVEKLRILELELFVEKLRILELELFVEKLRILELELFVMKCPFKQMVGVGRKMVCFRILKLFGKRIIDLYPRTIKKMTFLATLEIRQNLENEFPLFQSRKTQGT